MKITRTVVLILLFSVLFNGVTPAVSASTGSDYTKELNFISGLGIMEKHKEVNDFITRAELGAALMNLFSGGSYTADNMRDIKDSANSWEGEFLFKNLEFDLFDSDEHVNFEEVVLALINGLGYGYVAEEKGGYPYGYQYEAASLGITSKAVNAQLGECMRRGTTAAMIKNMLNIGIMSRFIGNKGGWEINNKDTLLSRLFVLRDSGIVTFDGLTSTNGVQSHFENDVVIMTTFSDQSGYGKKFRPGNSDAKEYLGKAVNYYYKYSEDAPEDVPTLLYVEERASVEEIKIDIRDITRLDGNRIVYGESGTTEITVNGSADIIYNGRWLGTASTMLTSVINGMLERQNGNVHIIDNGQGWDILFVEDYKTYRIDSVNSADSAEAFIRTTEGENIDCRSDSATTVTEVYKNGVKTELSRLVRDDVFFLAEAKQEDGIVRYRKVIAGKLASQMTHPAKVTGTLNEIGKDFIVVNDKIYEISYGFSNTASIDEHSKRDKLRLGSRVTVYFDPAGRVCDYDVADTGIKYGFLVALDQSKKSLEQFVQAKIYTAENEMKIFNLDKKVKYNDYGGGRIESKLLLENSNISNVAGYDPLYDNGGIIRQVVRYGLGGNGEITELYTAYLDAKLNHSDDYSKFRRNKAVYDILGSANMTYRSNVMGFFYNNPSGGMLLYADPSAAMFLYPEDDFAVDEYKYRVAMAADIFGNSNTYTRTLYAYDTDEHGISHCFANAWEGGASLQLNHETLTLVTKVFKTVNKNGDIVQKIAGLSAGKEISIIGQNCDSLKIRLVTGGVNVGIYGGSLAGTVPIEPGDLIVYKKNSHDMVESIALAFRPGDKNGVGGRPYVDSADNIRFDNFKMAFGAAYYPVISGAKAYSPFPVNANNNNTNSRFAAIYGRVDKLSRGMITIRFDDSVETVGDKMVFDVSKPVVYLYDISTKTAKISSVDEIMIGDEVFMKCRLSIIDAVVVIRR
ncbi:MAG: hypothetical protein M0R40_01620 [Firmicutes bacterium]|nr:hypothetical protein [Bacillota bacterium]